MYTALFLRGFFMKNKVLLFSLSLILPIFLFIPVCTPHDNNNTYTIPTINSNGVLNESINISYKEFMILEYLMNNSNQIISKEQIYDKIWGIDNYFESNNLEAYLSFVRKKLKIIDSDVTIKAIRGMGYKLEV